jgi:hypothetical protein
MSLFFIVFDFDCCEIQYLFIILPITSGRRRNKVKVRVIRCLDVIDFYNMWYIFVAGCAARRSAQRITVVSSRQTRNLPPNSPRHQTVTTAIDDCDLSGYLCILYFCFFFGGEALKHTMFLGLVLRAHFIYCYIILYILPMSMSCENEHYSV